MYRRVSRATVISFKMMGKTLVVFNQPTVHVLHMNKGWVIDCLVASIVLSPVAITVGDPECTLQTGKNDLAIERLHVKSKNIQVV